MNVKKNQLVGVWLESLHLTHTLPSHYVLPNVRPHYHHLATAVRFDCFVCIGVRLRAWPRVGVCDELLSNRWRNLIHVSFLPRCPLALMVCWRCYLVLTSILSAPSWNRLTPPRPALLPPSCKASDARARRAEGRRVELISCYLGCTERSASGRLAYCLQSTDRCCFCCTYKSSSGGSAHTLQDVLITENIDSAVNHLKTCLITFAESKLTLWLSCQSSL